MKRNLVLFFVSLSFWVGLISFFEKKHVWSILFVAFVVVTIGFLIKLHLHLRIKANYPVDYNIDIKEFVASIYYFLPLIIVFAFCTVFYGKAEITAPSGSDFIITITIGVWFSWMESVLITNSFVKQTIDSLSK